MYAIVEAGGRQWRVEAGSQLVVNRLLTPVGSQHLLEKVLLAGDEKATKIGSPYLKNAKVVCEVLEHGKGKKKISYKFTRRENYRHTRGSRQPQTKLLVKEISL
jgi:large subunit ribosomal protein L21